MKLLRDIFRRCMTGIRGVSGRGVAAPRAFSVTVPAPLAAAVDSAVVVELPVVAHPAPRREPASFLKTPRHRRLGAGR